MIENIISTLHDKNNSANLDSIQLERINKHKSVNLIIKDVDKLYNNKVKFSKKW